MRCKKMDQLVSSFATLNIFPLFSCEMAATEP